ncbi:MAG: T9SS type A sorting domain-containing protein [Bacteroidia bacterium]
MKIKVTYLFFGASILLSSISVGQGLLNNGARIVINNNTNVVINNAAGNYTSQSAGTIINNTAGGKIIVGGNWVNNASNAGFNNDGSTIILNGANQSIGGSSSTTFYNLFVQGSGTKKLANSITVGGQTLKTGVLSLGTLPLDLNSNMLTVSNGATNAITVLTGYIISETDLSVNPSVLQWNVGNNAGNYVFPFGVSGSQIPFTFSITSPMSSSGDFVAISTRMTQAADNQPWAGVSDVAAVTNMTDIYGQDKSVTSVIDRWWDINASSSVVANLVFSYRGSENTATASGFLNAQHWNGSSWDVPVGTGASVTSGVGTCTVTGASAFSPWVLSFATSALPVELIRFDHTCRENNAVINWSTRTEINNDYFQIERSRDALNYELVARINGAGNTTVQQNYSYSDNSYQTEKPYYRLKQVDFNGADKYYPAININDCGPSDNSVAIANNGSEIQIEFTQDTNENAEVSLYDMNGRSIRVDSFGVGKGTTKHVIDTRSFPAGIYLMRIERGGITTMSKKLLLCVSN